MNNFILITASLVAFSWISASVSEFHTVEVQPGGDVTLLCSNFSGLPLRIVWFKLAKRSNISCISSMTNSTANPSFCHGFQKGKFNMTSHSTALFLKIKQVDFSDTGLYFCGFHSARGPIISSATYLNVKVVESFDEKELKDVILGALIIVLNIIIFGLFFKINKLQTASKNGQHPKHSENLDSDALTYAALSFHSQAEGSRPPSDQLVANVYAATR